MAGFAGIGGLAGLALIVTFTSACLARVGCLGLLGKRFGLVGIATIVGLLLVAAGGLLGCLDGLA